MRRTTSARALSGRVGAGVRAAAGGDRLQPRCRRAGRATCGPAIRCAGLTPREFADSASGSTTSPKSKPPRKGSGPAFNGTSCAVCHNVPAIGGAGVVLETRAGYRDADGAFRGLNADGDTLIHLFSMPTHGCQPMIPDDVNVIARRAPIPLFGAGLVEAIPDDTLLALEDPLDRNRDGVSGRAAIVDRRGDAASGASAASAGRRSTRRCSPSAPTPTATRWASPTISSRAKSSFGIDDAADAPLRPDARSGGRARSRHRPPRHRQLRVVHALPRAGRAQPLRRRRRATASGSSRRSAAPRATCRRSRTGPSANPLFDRKPVPLFSDLLLHDIGTGDGIRQGAAEPRRSGRRRCGDLRLRRPLLHDGSAATIEDAIGRHRNEAELARRGFDRLSPQERQRLLAFLRSL